MVLRKLGKFFGFEKIGKIFWEWKKIFGNFFFSKPKKFFFSKPKKFLEKIFGKNCFRKFFGKIFLENFFFGNFLGKIFFGKMLLVHTQNRLPELVSNFKEIFLVAPFEKKSKIDNFSSYFAHR